MKKKIIVGSVILTLVFGGTGAFAYDRHVKEIEAEKVERFDKAKESVLSLYSFDQSTISSDVTEKKIIYVEGLLKELEDDAKNKDSLLKKTKDARIMFEAKEYLDGLIEGGLFVGDITNDKIAEIKSEVEKVKPLSDKLYVSMKSDLDLAILQFNHLTAANKGIKELEEKPSRKLYDEVAVLINKAPDVEKKELLNKLDKVDTLLIEKENEAKRIAQLAIEKENEAKRIAKLAIEEENNANVNSNSSNSNDNSAVSSQSVRQSENATNNQRVANSANTQRANNSSTSNAPKNNNVNNNPGSTSNSNKATTNNNKATAKTEKPSNTNKSSTAPKQNSSSDHMDSVNSALDAINKGNISQVGSGNTGTGRDWEEYEIN